MFKNEIYDGLLQISCLLLTIHRGAYGKILGCWSSGAPLVNPFYAVGSSDFDIFLEIQYVSCVFALALKS
jgi:hypothetical protein